MRSIDFVAIDWGSTKFRAWAMSYEGDVLNSVSSDQGLKSVLDRQFEAVIEQNCEQWLSAAPHIPILMAGMVGSKTGWHETVYADCPVHPSVLMEAAKKLTISNHPAAILPGARFLNIDGDNDVMRGEELQILGASHLMDVSDATICIPGTHCKWANLKKGKLDSFKTYVTGELFQLLRNQSLIGALAVEDEFSYEAFSKGIKRGYSHTLAHAVFAARANTLGGTLQPKDLSSYLSGVLIGAEIADQKQLDQDNFILMATGILADRYQAAFDILGLSPDRIDAKTATIAGLTMVAKQMWPHMEPA